MLSGVEAVIIDEIHAVASTKRGAHLALTLERLDLQAREGPAASHARVQRIGLSATQNPLEEVGPLHGRPAAPGADRRHRRAQAAGPADPRAGRVDGRARCPRRRRDRRPVPPPGGDQLPHLSGGEATRRSIWPAIYPELLRLVREHRSTIVFVNNRRAAERLALRLNDLAAGEDEAAGRPVREIARAHHGSLAREERTVVEELLKAGELPCLVATSSLELGIDMGAVDLVLQVESPKSVARGLQRIGRAGHGVGDVEQGAHLPQVPRRPARVRRGRAAHARGPDRADRGAAQRARRARPADRGDRRERASLQRRRPVRAGHPHPFLRASCRARCWRTSWTCSTAATLAASSGICVRGSCGIASAGTIRARARGPRARGDQRRHDPRPRAVRGHAARRAARRRARRGDGLRGRAGPGVPARRLVVADRGDRPRPRDRHPGARRPRRRAVLEGRRRRAAQGARRGDRRVHALGGRPARRGARARLRPRRAARRATSSTSCTSSRRPRACCRATARSSSSASATRSATGGCACCRRSAGASTPRGGWPCRRGSASATAWSPTRSGPTTGSSSTCPTSAPDVDAAGSGPLPHRRRARAPRPGRGRGHASSPSSAARRCSARAFARTPPARC